ncbi:rhodanese-like domain-containing protein [Brumimicrobium glaciale]|uniref:Rhodanese-like domain-containing protein n=1 Tax=Brumimicrobium glaciale TaxID=200475 RepID=A0A4V1WF59_9FLAO|nr:rhodanese-like domain-containing protein [Brumimicrobium glaciale]RYM32056.1 rhodanese-like domain-containing protein [Brumimicrobium glaciale]
MEDLSLSEWNSKLEAAPKAIILDVRRPDEWQQGIIPNAIMIDLMEINSFLDEVKKLDKNIPYFIYCRSGSRSHQACLVLEQMGFKETYNLDCGILGWDASTPLSNP